MLECFRRPSPLLIHLVLSAEDRLTHLKLFFF